MPMVDWGSRIEIWMCPDCVTVEETDDRSCFDLWYGKQADKIIAAVEKCLSDLKKPGTYFANDTSDEPQRECGDCYRVMRESDCEKVVVDEYDEDTFEYDYLCVECGSPDTKPRDHGEEEFSWCSCDCCGEDKAGQRTRYALFTKLLEEAND